MTQPKTDIPDVSSADMADKGEPQSIDWLEILTVLWSSRKLIALVTSSAELAMIVIFALPGRVQLYPTIMTSEGALTKCLNCNETMRAHNRGNFYVRR